MTLARLPSALERIEGDLAALYRTVASTLGDDPEAARVFTRLGLQEESHLNLVRSGRSLVRQNPRDFGPVELDTTLVDQLSQASQDVRAEPRTPTLEQAVAFALWAEGFAAERVHRSVLIDANPALGLIISRLGADDRRQQSILAELARSRGIGEGGSPDRAASAARADPETPLAAAASGPATR